MKQKIVEDTSALSSVLTDIQPILQDNILRRGGAIAAIIRGYFPSAEVETITENWSYELTQLIGEMGGSTGLFLGFSFLFIYTGIEIVWVAITKALYKAKPVPKSGDMTWIRSGEMNSAVNPSH